jgi:hypothetical protein
MVYVAAIHHEHCCLHASIYPALMAGQLSIKMCEAMYSTCFLLPLTQTTTTCVPEGRCCGAYDGSLRPFCCARCSHTQAAQAAAEVGCQALPHIRLELSKPRGLRHLQVNKVTLGDMKALDGLVGQALPHIRLKRGKP